MIAMTARPSDLGRRLTGMAFAALAALALAVPAAAQELESFDPDQAYGAQSAAPAGNIDGDLAAPDAPMPPVNDPAQPAFDSEFGDLADPAAAEVPGDPQAATTAVPEATAATYGEDDLIGAAEGVFGKGAEGLAKLIQDLLKDQGEPNGYIVGREAGGAFIVGVRYGSGTLYHKIEGTPAGLLDRAVDRASMSAPMPPTPLCWSTTSTTPRNSTNAFRRERGRPISSAD